VFPNSVDSRKALGAFIREARVARGITQARAAREAGVSRRHFALIEGGANVTVDIVLRIAHYLELSHVPLDGTFQLTAGHSGLNLSQLMDTLDLLGLVVEQVRGIVLDAVLPPSETRKPRDTQALEELLARLQGNEERRD
jgi:transcriptional regulator with XRE-family HTH domain